MDFALREIASLDIYQKLKKALLTMNVHLPSDVVAAIEEVEAAAEGAGKKVLGRVLENLGKAAAHSLPLCQDTGMLLLFVDAGADIHITGGELESTLCKAAEDAWKEGYFRASVVADPLKERKNSGTNLPPIIHYRRTEGSVLRIRCLAKGFGSENCSRIFMLKPTEGKEAVIAAVEETVRRAGGNPCPPVVLGVGIGGTMEYAGILSKRALLRKLDDKHPDPFYSELEQEILERINRLGIGPGGLGGGATALAVKVETCATHIAGLPVAVSVNCWADRKAEVIL
jgi:fumarate hydratase subunit alpha